MTTTRSLGILSIGIDSRILISVSMSSGRRHITVNNKAYTEVGMETIVDRHPEVKSVNTMNHQPDQIEADDIQAWIDSVKWYQTIELSNGLKTKGIVNVSNRFKYFKGIHLRGATVLDIGCNSGGYCLWAKKQGARRVVGIDIDPIRLDQARRLAEIEQLDIEFLNMGIAELADFDRFDVVICIAVLTEVTDLFGSLAIIKNLIGRHCLLELCLARPALYLSLSRNWLFGFKKISRRAAVMELLESKRGFMIAPTLPILRAFFGEEFSVEYAGKGERYDMLRIQRLCRGTETS
ncbi:MAG TPA: class I SAM-dependent methyltransferase [Caldilineaceae bacterium]|nr:class I SAM-dependent methyltransferase [Caldilineaceae bacterium]